jgi:hypothetical protein
VTKKLETPYATIESSLTMTASVDVGLCQDCKILETARVKAAIHYRDLMGARKEMLQGGQPVTPSLCAALVKAEIALNEIHQKLAAHQSAHGGR